MSRFRPTRKVLAPGGRTWEIYVTSGAGPVWKPIDYEPPTEELGFTPPSWLLAAAIEIPIFLFCQVFVPAARMLVELPLHAVRIARSRTRIVEAISFGPPREGWMWRTTPDHVDRVVGQVAGGLATGDVARPLGADFLGPTR